MANAFYGDFFTSVNSQLAGTISSTASAVIGAITPVATTLLMIYIALWAWSMARGMITEPITDGATRIVYLAIVIAIALSVGYYSGFLSDWLWNSPEAMANIIAPGNDPMSSMNFLDGMFATYNQYASKWVVAAEQNKIAVFPHPLYYLVAILIWIAAILFTGFAAALMVLAKIMLAILLGIGPIFVLSLIFQSTRKFFETWLGQCLNFVFMVILIAGLFAIVGDVITQAIADQVAGISAVVDNNPSVPIPVINPATAPSLIPAMGILAVTAICFIVLLQVPSVAAALGGGVAIGTMGAAGMAYHKIRGAALGGVRGGRWGARELSGRNRADRRFQALRRAETNRRWETYRRERQVTRTNTVKQG